MKMRLICAIVVIAAVGLTAGVGASYAYSQDGNKSGKDLVGKFCHKVSFIMEHEKDLALTEDQVKGIEELNLKAKKDLIKIGADIDVVGIDIEEALHQDSIDVTAINALIDKQYNLKKEKTKGMAASFAALKEIITAEQKDKMKELWKAGKKEKGHGSDLRGMMKCPKCSSKM